MTLFRLSDLDELILVCNKCEKPYPLSFPLWPRRIPARCPSCQHQWSEPFVSHTSRNIAHEMFLHSVSILREGRFEGKDPGFTILLQFKEVGART